VSVKRYATYRDSGITRLGDIPSHWSLSRFCYETWVRARLGWKGLKAEEYVDDGYVFLATPNIKDAVIDFEKVNYITQERYDESPEIKLQPNDVLLSKDGSTLGTVNVVRELPREATVNSSVAVITPTKGMDGRYLMYYIKSSYIQNLVWILQDGMGVPHLFQKDINKIRLLVPPVEEQHDIADYLDRRVSAINEILTGLEHQGSMLETFKKELIAEAIIKGLDKGVPMKESGVEWIGAVPEHWSVERIGSLYTERSTKVSDVDYPALSVTKNGIVPQLKSVALTDHGDNRKLVKAGDFVINSRSDRRGSCGISSLDGSVTLISIVLKPLGHIYNPYYNYVFRTVMFADEFYRWGYGIVNDLWSTKWSSMKRIYIQNPPMDEQIAIVNYLDKRLVVLDGLIADINAQIEKLKQYRQIVIHDAVTGKIKVTEG
jgi:type I restriction enzyme S subunit